MAKQLTPQQGRSRKTSDALLRATVETLEAGGMAACTLPRVAAAAGVSAASVYRRFEDKDALLRAVFLQVLAERHEAAAKSLEQSSEAGGLEGAAERLVAALTHQCRSHDRLLRSLEQFIEADHNPDFARQASEASRRNLQMLADSLLRHEDRIRHPEPDRAATFAVVMANATVAACVREAKDKWKSSPAMSDKQITAEVARAVVGYLRRKA